jgi:hypothetical protein
MLVYGSAALLASNNGHNPSQQEQEPQPPATFKYYGASSWEIETLYDVLSRSYGVVESEVPADDSQFVTLVEISFPVPFGEPFFRDFSPESWFKVKGILKDMKKRRGKKGVKTYIRFAGFIEESGIGTASSDGGGSSSSSSIGATTTASNNAMTTPIVFPILSKGDRQYEMGIEKLEYLVDIVPLQLKAITPDGAEEIWYSYDEVTFKWSPSTLMVNGINYLYKNNQWVKPPSSPPQQQEMKNKEM